MTNYSIRSAQSKDMPQLIALCAAHAAYEQAEYDSKGKVEQLAKDLFCECPKLFCIVVEREKNLIGYATYMKQYATWDAGEYVYMDCLFMQESARGFGIGERLVREIQVAAKLMGCDLIQWQTPEFNVRAIKFYHRIGAVGKSKERFFLS